MRILVVLALAAVAVYLVLRLFRAGAPRVESTPAPRIEGGEYEEPAAIASGPDRGFGVLRLTPSQLIFAGNSGRVTTVERLDIVGVAATKQLPDHDTVKPVLAVSTTDGVHYFAVDDPGAWEVRLLHR
ncbi:MAG: hypothetical protein MUD05_07935 [Candidatus Nanopelagicales bacterium]|jgi:hypothetical protein|nr:hypothetical protein [Candidatus Nanopelagicales bacterium]